MATKATKKWEIITHLYPRTKISQYFEKDPSIYIEKIRKKWMGDPRQLEEDLETIRSKNFFIENQNTNLRKEVADLKKECDALKVSEVSLKTQLANSVGDATKESIVHSNTITRLGEELNKVRQYEKTIRKETYKLEKECQNLQGSLKNWTPNQIRKWLKDFYSQFNKVFLPETYGLVNEGFYLWIRSLEKIDNLKKDVDSWKTVYELEKDKVKERDQIITGKDDRIIQLNEILKGSSAIFSNQQTRIDELIKQLEVERDKVSTDTKLKSHLQEDIKRLVGERKDLTQLIQKLKDEEVKNKAVRDQELADLRVEKQRVENEVNAILTKWKAKDLTDLSEGIQAIVNELDASDEELKNRANSIKVLKAKNEKYKENNKKLYGYLGEAWKLISHLQTDLATEKQDKAHIQQELNNALTILNKPTAEMGTQTDLTSEQISQMEKDLEEKTTKIAELEKNREKLDNQITQKETEINQLKEQTKDLEPNDTERKILEYVPYVKSIPNHAIKSVVNQLKSGEIDGKKWDWSQLSEVYSELRIAMENYLVSLLVKMDISNKWSKEQKARSDLQTKYDMEVRSKEELIKFLNIYRTSPLIPVLLNDDTIKDEKLMNEHIRSNYNSFWKRIVIVNNFNPGNTSGVEETITFKPKISYLGGIDFISISHQFQAFPSGRKLEILPTNITQMWNFKDDGINKIGYVSGNFSSVINHPNQKAALNYYPGNSKNNPFFCFLNGDESLIVPSEANKIKVEADKITIG